MPEIKSLVQNAARWPAQLLFPPTCGGCRRIVSQPGTLCGACWQGLRFLERPWCEILGVPFSHDMGAGIVSADAIANPPPFDRARAAVAHSGVAKQMVHQLKYADRTDLAPWMAAWMVRAGQELLGDADLIVPVPLHRRRFLSRRFNQSAELARSVARLSRRRYDPTIVSRVKPTQQQVGLGARQRQDNVRGAFKVDVEAEIDVAGRKLVVVDDVYTTGATVAAVSKALRKAGAVRIDVLTFSRVLPGDFRDEELATI
jgi:ComF family protein